MSSVRRRDRPPGGPPILNPPAQQLLPGTPPTPGGQAADRPERALPAARCPRRVPQPRQAVAGRGLGLTGPGAPGAARALLIGLLAAASPGRGRPGAQVVIPVADMGQL